MIRVISTIFTASPTVQCVGWSGPSRYCTWPCLLVASATEKGKPLLRTELEWHSFEECPPPYDRDIVVHLIDRTLNYYICAHQFAIGRSRPSRPICRCGLAINWTYPSTSEAHYPTPAEELAAGLPSCQASFWSQSRRHSRRQQRVREPREYRRKASTSRNPPCQPLPKEL
jgi:hypothetical protein